MTVESVRKRGNMEVIESGFVAANCVMNSEL